MDFYKCKDCGLLVSEEIETCPKCGSTNDKLVVDVNNDQVFVISTEDLEYVIDNLGDEKKKELLSNYSFEEVRQVVQSKLEMPWDEYIEGCIEARLLWR